ncbi:MAG TPA: O-antigen ligase family protein, partial [Chitinophagales bacterium]|nr:O-antigen ligase family protein [Chitinophagales bacterium]
MERAINKLELSAFILLGVVTIASLLAAFGSGLYYLALIPFGLLVVYTGIINFRLLFYMLWVAIPLSMEYSFSSSLGTDLPDEPLMIGLMFITFAFILTNYKSLPTGYFANVIIIALSAHLFWIFLSAITSVNQTVSFKVFLAKLWYITTFSLLSAFIIRNKDDLKKMFWCVYIPLTLLIVQVIIRHARLKFAFDEVNTPMPPFFRNHVNYAAILSVFFPFILLARTWYQRGTFKRRLLNFSILFYIIATYLSYTRTDYLALLLIYPLFWVIRHKLMKPVLLFIGIGATLFVANLFHNNHFLDYAPVYQETIYHDDFEKHLSSTFEGKDVSSMERVYRWVAATRMFKDHPWVGFGPGNFYPYYKRYTLSDFRTYVSDNPERSTTHNYLLFTLTEQGTIGLVIFLI